MESKYEFKKITDLLKSDDEDIKQQLIIPGLFLMVFESFKKYVVSTVDEFFSDPEYNTSSFVRKRGAEFKEIIKNFGKRKNKAQHKDSTFRGALHFFSDLDAITSEEVNEIERLSLVRNDVGHELFNIIVDDRKPIIIFENIDTIMGLYSKIHKWYIKEIEAEINPLFIENKDNIDFENVTLFEIELLKIIISKALLTKKEREEVNLP
ncbi:hypothetical protein [Rickettsiella endosymbiont of Dermanyssus gallinae]|uniref:hypothetical protein n=1 Tax=Rickettsiella endosymbiont of Dermanyssus gallinae TaxID=2856608 RepID=UPI001C52F759|nr:hypothetical protein [Rickettsiella endosymbiont of Dermanyssus gallinae]